MGAVKLRYQITADYNLKCWRLFVEDGSYWKDLGPLTGTDEAVAKQTAKVLASYEAAYGLIGEWVDVNRPD